jgi:hypothetical protein
VDCPLAGRFAKIEISTPFENLISSPVTTAKIKWRISVVWIPKYVFIPDLDFAFSRVFYFFPYFSSSTQYFLVAHVLFN